MATKPKTLPMKMSRDWLVSMLENDTLPKGMTYSDIVTGVSSKQEAIDFLKKQPEFIG
tara:strand:- start:1446 stop:1619 length:174 start_codon:yes stop_codon:yes gene_type:complete